MSSPTSVSHNLSVANSSVMRGRAPWAVLHPSLTVEGPVYKDPVQAHTVGVSLQLQWLWLAPRMTFCSLSPCLLVPRFSFFHTSSPNVPEPYRGWYECLVWHYYNRGDQLLPDWVWGQFHRRESRPGKYMAREILRSGITNSVAELTDITPRCLLFKFIPTDKCILDLNQQSLSWILLVF